MTNQISTISFNNQSLITFEQNGTHYTAMKPICENIGLAWNAQLLRIKRDEILSQGMIVMIIPSNGGEQQMVCLPIEYLNGWLFGIDVKRVRPEIRETLIKYKKECYQALHNYWFNGKAERSQNPQQTLPLAKNEIEVIEPTLTPTQQHQIQELVQGVHVHTEMSYAEIYSRLKNKFKVAKYDQIPQSQYREAIKYLGGLPMMDMPKQVTFSMFEVLPLAIMLGHLRTLMVDFNIIHSQLKNKDDTLAKMLNNHYQQFNADAPLFHRVQSAIARLIDSLPEKEREFAFDMVYKI